MTDTRSSDVIAAGHHAMNVTHRICSKVANKTISQLDNRDPWENYLLADHVAINKRVSGSDTILKSRRLIINAERSGACHGTRLKYRHKQMTQNEATLDHVATHTSQHVGPGADS